MTFLPRAVRFRIAARAYAGAGLPIAPAESADVAAMATTSPVVGDWLVAVREDPTTGLVCWPDFDAAWPSLAADLREGNAIGVAIRDVDDLTGYVETANTSDPRCWGHLASNQYMRDAGRHMRTWLANQPWTRARLATFGGDELVLAARIDTPTLFLAHVAGLHDQLNAALPRTVSWVVTWVRRRDLPELRGDALRLWLSVEVLGRLDRPCLVPCEEEPHDETQLHHGPRTREVAMTPGVGDCTQRPPSTWRAVDQRRPR